MSVCGYPSLVRVSAPGGPSVVRVAAPASPQVVREAVPGIPGPPGATGPAGVSAGFGQIAYSRMVADPASLDPTVTGDQIVAGVPLLLAFTPDPGLTANYLNPPFAAVAFWDGTKIVGRALADRLEVQVNLIVRSQRAGGNILLEVDAGSPVGPIISDNYDLQKPAGVNERVTLRGEFQTLGFVMANGARLMLTSSVPAAIFRESVVVAPQSLYLGTGA